MSEFKDISKNLKLYEQKAELYEDSQAMDLLGMHYFKEKNLDKAIYWLDKAAKKENHDHIFELGVCFHKKGDYENALNCFLVCDREEGHFMMGYYRYKGFFRAPLSVALSGLDSAAKQGYKKEKAYLCSGYLCQKEKQYSRAYSYFEKAAEQGSNIAVFEMAQCLLNEKESYENTQKVIELLEEAGRNGYREAYSKLGCIYANGELTGVEKDINKATRFYLQDEDNLDKEILFSLMKEGSDAAWVWAESEIRNGNGSVAVQAALFYILGLGIDKNIKKAKGILLSEETSKSIFSLMILAYCYENGIFEDGVDIVRAFQLKQQALSLDSNIAQNYQESIIKEVNYSHKKEAEKLKQMRNKKQNDEEEIRHNKNMEISIFEMYHETMTCFSKLSEKLDRNHRESMEKFDNISKDVLDLKAATTELLDEIEELGNQCKKDGQNISEVLQKLMEKEEQLSVLLKEKATQICNDTRHSNVNDIKKTTAELKAFFGQKYWGNLEDYVKNNLITGQVLFDKLKDEELSHQIDYSCVCICVCSALEYYLKKIFIKDLQNYLENTGVEVKDWPALLTYVNKGKIQKGDGRNFSLGGIPYYLGINKSDNNYAEYINRFVEYAKDVTGITNFSVNGNLKGLVDRLERVRRNYRNPAAHTGFLEQFHAAECLHEVIMSRKDAEHKIKDAKGLILEFAVLFYP